MSPRTGAQTALTVTMDDVAAEAGVSRTAVSRVLLGQKKVSDHTRRKVRAAAEKLGYVPNAMARELASRTSNTVGLLLRDAANPAYGLLSVSLASVWMQLGYNLLVLSAGLGAVPDDVVEAARLDGAHGWRLQRSIIMPMLTPQLFFLLVTGTIHALQSFGQIHILTRGGPDRSTQTLVYSIYDVAFANNNSNYGAGSAQAMVLLIVVLAITVFQFGFLERKVFYA